MPQIGNNLIINIKDSCVLSVIGIAEVMAMTDLMKKPSAGGHLASTAATHYTKDCRPDFQLLLYPVISMCKETTHQGSRQNLLGNNPSNELTDLFSNELQVNEQTPPALLIHCSDDEVVKPENSIRYYQALLTHKVPATLLCYPKGGHGWGFTDHFAFKELWLDEVKKWLEML